MTKSRGHPWPTDGATRKYVDRATDALHNRLDRQTEKIRDLKDLIQSVQDTLVALHGAGRRD